MLAIWKREVQNYFLTSIGYVFIGIFVLVGGAFFALYNILSVSADLSTMLGNMNYVFMLITPILTMKLLAEDGIPTEMLRHRNRRCTGGYVFS